MKNKIEIHKNVNLGLVQLIPYKDLVLNKEFWRLLLKRVRRQGKKYQAKITIKLIN